MSAVHVPRVDAHIHLWDPELLPYPWLQLHAPLQRRFLPNDYDGIQPAADRRVDAVVVVEANVGLGQGIVEAAWLDWVAAVHPRIAGIVAYVDMLDEERRDHAITRLRRIPCIVGVRHNIQHHSAGYATQRRFVDGVRAAGAAGYSFDLCVTASQLQEARELVARCPEVRFVLDHCGKPDIGSGNFDAWRRAIDDLAANESVACKLSGLFTEVGSAPSDERILRPYLRHIVESFGPRRVMYASDWPVCTLAGSADAWHALVADVVSGLCSRHERDEIFGGTAIRAYRLSIPAPA